MAMLILASMVADVTLAGELTPGQKLAAIKAKVQPTLTISDSVFTVIELAGHYALPGDTFSVGGLAGEDLYLFPDSTYIYVKWADIEPTTVHGKGGWIITNSVVSLQDDGSITSSYYGASSTYLALAVTNIATNVFRNLHLPASSTILLDAGRPYSYLMERRANWGWLLFICGLERRDRILQKDAEVMRLDIMRRAWRPDYFREDKSIQQSNAPYSSPAAGSKR